MSTGVIRISAALFALALLVGVFGLNTQPTQAILEVDISSNWASAPAAREYIGYMSAAIMVTEGPEGATYTRYKRDTDARGIRMASSGGTLTLTDLKVDHERVGEGFAADEGDYQYKVGVTQTTVDKVGTDHTAAITAIQADTTLDNDAMTAAEAAQVVKTQAAYDALRLQAATDPGLVGLPDDSYVDDWVEVLTGLAAGEVGLITKYDAGGTISFDPARGLHPMGAIASGDLYRIVEENPNRTVMVKIYHDEAPPDDPATRDVDESTKRVISVGNSGVGKSNPFTYDWTSGTVGRLDADDETVPVYFKFDLLAQNDFTTLTVGGEGNVDETGANDLNGLEVSTVAGGVTRNEPLDHWVGRTITVGTKFAAGTVNAGEFNTDPDDQGEATQTRLIIASGIDGTITVFPRFVGNLSGDDYDINMYEVPAYEDQTASFQYGIFRRNVTTDRIGPIISSVSPSKGKVLQDGDILFMADVIDVSSGYTSNEDTLEDAKAIGNGLITLEILENFIPGKDITWTKIADGWRLSYENSFGTPDQTIPLDWRIIARDRAGAQTIEDRTTGTSKLTVDGKNPEAVGSNSQRVYKTSDYPDFDTQLLQTRTGDNWRASNAADERWRMGGSGSHDKPVRVKSENRKGILVVFDEAGGLDVSTVDATDFSVDGVTPTSVTVADVFEDSQKDPSSSGRRPQEVFLVMGSNLPSDGKDSDGNRLEVVLSGTIKDVAGNNANSATIRLADGIPPKITVTIDDADMFDQEEVTVKVAVDETLLSAPTLTVRRSISTTLKDWPHVDENGDPILKDGKPVIDTDQNVSMTGDEAKPIMENTASQAYSVDIDITDGATVPAANQASLLSVVVNALDVASNEEEAGDDDDWTQAGAYTFQLDPELNNGMAPGVTVAGNKIFDGKLLDATGETTDDAEIEVVDPLLITIDFGRECADDRVGGEPGCDDGGEAKEYSGDTHKTVTLSGVDVDVDLADGNSASPEPIISSSDNVVYTLSISNPPVGIYTISFRAEDEAGNVSLTSGAAIAETLESEFTVKAAVPTELSLSPGWNLISLPFQPSNPGINSVLPSGHPASLVMSYDNASGLWVVSRRSDETGMFQGDVMQMVATTAYFVFTDSLDPIKLIRPGLATAAAAPAVPSAIAVKAGWNLIPVLTYQTPLPGSPPGSGGVSADDYLGALRNSQGDAAWLRALLWDTTSQTWKSVAPGETVTLSYGATNPCTDDTLNVTDVENGVEPCQAEQDNNFKEGTDDAEGFTEGNTVVLERHLPLGAGLWVWSTIDSVIFPTS